MKEDREGLEAEEVCSRCIRFLRAMVLLVTVALPVGEGGAGAVAAHRLQPQADFKIFCLDRKRAQLKSPR